MVARKYSLLLTAALMCAAVNADAGEWTSLEQSQPTQTQTASAPAAGTAAPRTQTPPAPVSNNALQVLYGQIEQLQQEVQTLRGLVEEQGNEITRLKNEQKDRYLELDRRLSQMLNQGAATSAPAAADNDDAAQYDAAFALVRDKRYTDAIKAFNTFVAKYPKSSYTPNAYYWLGQVYYAQDELDEARKAFSMVVNQFADNQKVPESRFKLGVILHRLGQADKAKTLLQAVVKDYAKSAPSISRLADTYLRENLK